MAETKCGFDGVSAREMLVSYGPTLFVDVGFDPTFKLGQGQPAAGIKDLQALVDSGAVESCIDALLAAQLNLPVVDRRNISRVGGSHTVNMHLAQVFVPSLNFTIYGMFAGVGLAAGGQPHKVLIGRSFLQNFTMVYEGRTGSVTISSQPTC
jgi:hypothetical protein